MSVKELIEALSALPQDAYVTYVWDGSARGNADVCYLSKDGEVLLASKGDALYDGNNILTSGSGAGDYCHNRQEPNHVY